jgi:hypothetical protein
LSTSQVEALLADRFAAPEYATLFNVKNRTGYGKERYADALSMNLYPSRGLELSGFEIKVSRSDWLREKDDPAKAEEIQRYCDRWYLVLGAAEIVKPGELPPTWGLIVPDRGALKIAIEAPRLSPHPLDRVFIAAMLRRATEQSPDVIKAAEFRGYERGHKKGSEMAEAKSAALATRLEQQQETHSELIQKVHRFEQAAGISIVGYRVDAKIGEAVRLVLAGMTADLEKYRAQMAHLVERVDESIATLKAT